MVSTRRGSLSGAGDNNAKNSNDNKASSSSTSDDKPPSPKRQKAGSDNGNGDAFHKPTTTVDPPPAPPSAAASTPVAQGFPPTVPPDKPTSLNSWSAFAKNMAFDAPWCKLLSQQPQNPNVLVCTSHFTIGSSKQCGLYLKDPTVSSILCKIKHTQLDGNASAMLEITGSKQTVQVNGVLMKRTASCALKSGDEISFGLLGNYSYIFQLIVSEVATRMPVESSDIHNKAGKVMRIEKKSRDSAIAGASILASISNLKHDLSRIRATMPTTNKTQKGADFSSSAVYLDGSQVEADGSEVNLTSTMESNRAGESTYDGKDHLCSDLRAEALEERSDIVKDLQPASTSASSLRCTVFREDIKAGILDCADIDVSFEDFPYYLSEYTKSVLVAASCIHLKHRDHVKYTTELLTVNPRILLSGPAGSDIYQEMLVKALAKYFGAKLLIFDSQTYLGSLSLKEAECLKEGLSEEMCTTSKQSEQGEPNSSTDPLCDQVAWEVNGQTLQPKSGSHFKSSSGSSKNYSFKFGDKVRFTGSTPVGPYSAGSAPARGPSYGARGKVLLPFEDNPVSKIGVRFDKPLIDGVDLGGLCEPGYGCFCCSKFPDGPF